MYQCSGCSGVIGPAHVNGKCLDVEQASPADGARIVQFTCNNQGNQLWLMRPPRYSVSIYPPGPGALTAYSHLHCKFHGACGYGWGSGLDWESWTYGAGNRDGYFRAYTQALSGGTSPINGYRSFNQVDLSGCDFMTVSISDPGLSGTRGIVTYYHARTNLLNTNFSISLNWSQNYATTAVDDSNCCCDSQGQPLWSGYHIHEKSDNTPALLNSDIYFHGGSYGDYCGPDVNHISDNCNKPRNDYLWSRLFDW
jgi:hypothetical protein